MDILVWGGLGNSDYLEKMMSFSNIYLYFWLKSVPCKFTHLIFM